MTPFHLASQEGTISILPFLLAKDADLEAETALVVDEFPLAMAGNLDRSGGLSRSSLATKEMNEWRKNVKKDLRDREELEKECMLKP
jgi:hypothetical protein